MTFNAKQAAQRVLGAATHYEVLDVMPGASDTAVKAAHKRLAWAFHPDRSGLLNAHDLMAKVNVAYTTLGDPKKRKTYDMMNKIKAQPCLTCKGKGFIMKQRGFAGKVEAPCPMCETSGVQP